MHLYVIINFLFHASFNLPLCSLADMEQHLLIFKLCSKKNTEEKAAIVTSVLNIQNEKKKKSKKTGLFLMEPGVFLNTIPGSFIPS